MKLPHMLDAHRDTRRIVVAKKGKSGGKAAQKTTGQGPNLKLFYSFLALVAVVGIGWIGYSVVNRDGAAAVDPSCSAALKTPRHSSPRLRACRPGTSTAP